MTTVYVDCPQCGDEIEVEMEYEPSDYECNVAGGYFASSAPLIRYCECVLTDAEVAKIVAEAETKASDPDYFCSEDG
jgi:hypothetical protein